MDAEVGNEPAGSPLALYDPQARIGHRGEEPRVPVRIDVSFPTACETSRESNQLLALAGRQTKGNVPPNRSDDDAGRCARVASRHSRRSVTRVATVDG